MQFEIQPKIELFESCAAFARAYAIGAGDLVVTNRYIYEPMFGALKLDCEVVFQEEFGAGEPSDDMAEAIYRSIRSTPRRVIAIGGGTVLDISKLFALRHVSPILDLYDGKLPVERDKELVLVPTTCGTGSEMTNIAILSLNSRGTKKGLTSPEMYADAAVLIPELLESLPFRFFATSSIDALIHAVESALSPKANEYTKLFSYRAMDMILRGYLAIRERGQEARKPLLRDFLIAANYAGIAFGNAGCAAVHALSYPLGAAYHVAHGEANYALFTGVMKRYLSIRADGEIATLADHVARILNCDSARVFDELDALLAVLIAKRPLREYGMRAEEIDSFTDSVLENQQRLLANNFVALDRAQIRGIYEQLY